MEHISVAEAAERKGCTKQAVRDAIRKEKIDAVKVGKVHIVITTPKWDEWKPNPNMQKSGYSRWSPSKAAPKAKKSRRSA